MSADVLVSVRPDEAGPYRAALAAVGIEEARIRVLDPADPEIDRRRLTAEAAGVVLAGGRDVDPARWGEEALPAAGLRLEPERDSAEEALVEGARGASTPLWAVCRGMQFVDVALGGSLWQDLALQHPGALSHRAAPPRDRLAHPVVATGADHPLAELLPRRFGVNSRHHQAVRELAPPLVALAVAPDGIVEAFAGRDGGWWLLGVQWHPEDLLDDPVHRGLWAAFAAAVEARATR